MLIVGSIYNIYENVGITIIIIHYSCIIIIIFEGGSGGSNRKVQLKQREILVS